MKIAVLGLGEAGSHFANDLVKLGIEVSTWDPDPKRTLDNRVRFAKNNIDAIDGADIILSVNLSKVSKAVAIELLPHLRAGQIYCEMNTSSPQLKLDIHQILAPSKVCFVDLAIMSPVPPYGIRVPLLASGDFGELLAEKLQPYHLNLTIYQGKVGEAAKLKLLRSIVYKGIAAVICEAMDAGAHFGLEDYMRQQIHSVMNQDDALIDRFLEGSRTHAERRMYEMQTVVEMLESEGLHSNMSYSSAELLKSYFQASTGLK
jgi:3-hydroxyisobutyrate dehydrogenase-like beta-hydroxyacid dehydrogenase